jgi:hypothetical protein
MVAEDNWNDRNHPNAEREAKQKFGRPFIAAKRWLRTCTRFIVLHDPARVVSARSGVIRDASKPKRPAFPLFRGLPSIVAAVARERGDLGHVGHMTPGDGLTVRSNP